MNVETPVYLKDCADIDFVIEHVGAIYKAHSVRVMMEKSFAQCGVRCKANVVAGNTKCIPMKNRDGIVFVTEIINTEEMDRNCELIRTCQMSRDILPENLLNRIASRKLMPEYEQGVVVAGSSRQLESWWKEVCVRLGNIAKRTSVNQVVVGDVVFRLMSASLPPEYFKGLRYRLENIVLFPPIIETETSMSIYKQLWFIYELKQRGVFTHDQRVERYGDFRVARKYYLADGNIRRRKYLLG